MSKGYLIINSTAAHRIIPIKNTKVIISQNNNNIKEFLTDDSGKTTLFETEAPDIELSESPQPDFTPFSVVDVIAEKEGFFTTYINNVQIFPERITTLYINMVPIPEYGENTPLTVETIPQNL